MFNLIPVSLLIMALGGIIYIASNHLSEFLDDDKDDKATFGLKIYFIKYVNRLPLDNVKNQSLSLIQKALHRFRLALLKTDNHLMKLIGKISEKDKQINGNSSNGNNNGADFWENLSKNKEENKVIDPIINGEAKVEFAVDKNKKIEKFFDIKPAKKTLRSKKSLK